jgi:hypothetical protein
VHSRLRLARRRFAAQFPGASSLDDYEGLLRSARRGATPTKTERRRAWSAVAIAVGRGAGVTGVLSSWPAIAFVCGSVLATSTWAGAALDDPARPIRAAPSREATIVAAEPPPDEDAPVLPEVRAIAEAPPRSDPPPRATPPRRATSKASDRLREETTLLASARAEINRGDPEAALGLIRRHANAFPRGSLLVERHRLEVDALCRLGRRSEAHVALARLDAIAPDRAKGSNPCDE